MSLNGTLDSLVEELRDLLVRAEAEVDACQLALGAAKSEAARIRAILKAAGAAEEEEKPKPKPKVRSAVRPETAALVLKAIWEHEQAGRPAIEGVPGSFAISDLEGDFHETSARAAVYELREQGVIRVVGKKPVGRARSPLAYARVTREY